MASPASPASSSGKTHCPPARTCATTRCTYASSEQRSPRQRCCDCSSWVRRLWSCARVRCRSSRPADSRCSSRLSTWSLALQMAAIMGLYTPLPSCLVSSSSGRKILHSCHMRSSSCCALYRSGPSDATSAGARRARQPATRPPSSNSCSPPRATSCSTRPMALLCTSTTSSASLVTLALLDRAAVRQASSRSAPRSRRPSRERRLSPRRAEPEASSSTCAPSARQLARQRRAPMLNTRCAPARRCCGGPAMQRPCSRESCASMMMHADWLCREGSARAEAIACGRLSSTLRGRSVRCSSLAISGSAATSAHSSWNTSARELSRPHSPSMPSISISIGA
mmetsp:Transcript_43823/g.109970  ORF Transcript_43823/g.109970 Transcript_43823/m.109970 type:complete len:339 (+) Transcript_43823:504-1520(+)